MATVNLIEADPYTHSTAICSIMQDGKDFTGCQHIDSLYLIIPKHCVCLSTPSAAICKACGLAPSEQQSFKK